MFESSILKKHANLATKNTSSSRR